MGCCEKLKYERLKDLGHASVLACQEANIRNIEMFVVKRVHKDYGDYYIGVREIVKGERVYKTWKPGQSMKKKKNAKGSPKYKRS